MATNYAGHGTLSGTNVSTVTLLNDRLESICVVNRAGATTLYFTINGAAPTAAADDTFAVPAGASLTVPTAGTMSSEWAVRIIGNGNDYSVMGA